MDILFNMRAFVSVAETGSFTAAAQRLDLTTAYVSRAVAKLEAHLQTRLLHRTTRRIALTEAGQRYLMRAQQILAYIEEAEAEAGDAHARPSGTLKVHAMTGIGQHYLIKAISQYCETYPEVGFDLTLANRITDILDEGYDISVVIAPELPDSGFVSKCIGQTYSILCASPGYIAAHGFPKLPAELSAHRCLRLVNIGDVAGPLAVRRSRRPGTGLHQPDAFPGQHRRRHDRGGGLRHGYRRAAGVRSGQRPEGRQPGAGVAAL